MAWKDSQNNCFRICLVSDFSPAALPEFNYASPPLSTPSLASSAVSSPEAIYNSKARASSKKNKVPRPPNAFILYRQHHHPLMKSKHPDMHNNDISVILGKQWKVESEHIKAEFRGRADKIKAQHALENPGYQYAPRKPSEKKKRMTARKMAQLRSAEIEAQNFPSFEMLEVADHERSESEIAIDMGETNEADIFPSTTVPKTSAAGVLGVMNPSTTGKLLGLDEERMDTVVRLPAPQPALDQQLASNIPAAGTVTFNDLTSDLVGADSTQSTLNDQDFLNSLIDWEGLREDLHVIRQQTGEEPYDLTGTETGTALPLSDEAALAEFHEELERVMKLI